MNRPRSSVTTILMKLVGRSFVSAITQTPASGPLPLRTVPAMTPSGPRRCACSASPVSSEAQTIRPARIRRVQTRIPSLPKKRKSDYTELFDQIVRERPAFGRKLTRGRGEVRAELLPCVFQIPDALDVCKRLPVVV